MKYKVWLLAIMWWALGPCLLVQAQRGIIDSLHHLLRTHTANDTHRVNRLTELAYRYHQISPDSTRHYAAIALRLAQKLGYGTGLGRAYNRLALGYSAEGLHAKSMEYYLKSLNIADSLGDLQGQASALNNIGYLYRLQENYPKAFAYTWRAVRLNKTRKSKASLAVNYTNLGWLYEQTKRHTLALDTAMLAAKLADGLNDKYAATISRHIVGKAYAGLHQDSLALVYFGQALQLATQIQMPVQVAFNLAGIGAMRARQARYPEAITQLQAAVALGRQTKTPEVVQEASQLLASIYRQQGNYQEALELLDLYHFTKDSIYNLRQTQQFDVQEFENRIEQQRLNIAALQQNEALRQTQLWGLLLLAAALTAIVLVVVRNRRKLHKANLALTEKNEAIEKQREQLVELTEQLRATNAYKDKLFTILAHDLRSPLASLKNMIDVIQMGDMDTAELQVVQKHLSGQFVRIDNLLANLLLWVREQMQGASHQPETLDLGQLVRDCFGTLASQAEEKQLALNNQVQPNTSILADANQCKVILRNLVANAIKFTPRHGHITVAAQLADTNHWQITISDDGRGMSAKQVASLFNPRTHHSTADTSGFKSSGLGLLLVKEFVENNGGKLWVQSTEGKGSTFYFTLPAHRP